VAFSPCNAALTRTWLVHGSTPARRLVSSGREKSSPHRFYRRVEGENVLEIVAVPIRPRRIGLSNLISLSKFHSDVITFSSEHAELPRRCFRHEPSRAFSLGIQNRRLPYDFLVDEKACNRRRFMPDWRGTLQRIVCKQREKCQMELAPSLATGSPPSAPHGGWLLRKVGTEVRNPFSIASDDAPEWFDEFRTGDEPIPLHVAHMNAPRATKPPPKNVMLDLRKAIAPSPGFWCWLAPPNNLSKRSRTAAASRPLFSYP